MNKDQNLCRRPESESCATGPVGLIGVGLVGAALTERLRANGYDVVAYDIDPKRLAVLERLGGTPAASAREVAERSRRVILSLFDTETVVGVVEEEGGVLSADTPPVYLIDTTTGDPDETIALATRLRARGVHLLDATISGSSEQIRTGHATFMIGGEESAFAACRDLFDAVVGHVFYLGPSGSGSKAKLATNLLIGLNRLALAEGLVFAEHLGLDLREFLMLARRTPGYSAVMDGKGEKMISADFSPESRVRQHRKDLALILKYAARAEQELPLSRVHARVLDALIAQGEGDLDNAAVIRAIRRLRHHRPH